jgi:hypothetical protein
MNKPPIQDDRKSTDKYVKKKTQTWNSHGKKT